MRAEEEITEVRAPASCLSFNQRCYICIYYLYCLWCAQSSPTFCNPMDYSLPGSPLSMAFSRREHWSGLRYLLLGSLPTQGLSPRLLHLLHRQVDFFTPVPPGMLHSDPLGKAAVKTLYWTSVVVRWLRICPLMQGTWVPSLVREDPACSGTAKPLCHGLSRAAMEPTYLEP